MTTLDGTPKQIPWAAAIREASLPVWEQALAWLRENHPEDAAAIEAAARDAARNPWAADWIDAREWRKDKTQIADVYALLWKVNDPRWKEHKLPRIVNGRRMRSLREQWREAVAAVLFPR